MSHNVTCPYCQSSLANTPESANRVLECPRCGAPFQMPPLPKAKFAPPPPPPVQQPQQTHSQFVQPIHDAPSSHVNPYQSTPGTHSHVPVQQSNLFGIISIVLAAMGLFSCGFTCVPGFAFALIGLRTQPNTTAVIGLVFNGVVAVPLMLLFFLGGLGAMMG